MSTYRKMMQDLVIPDHEQDAFLAFCDAPAGADIDDLVPEGLTIELIRQLWNQDESR